MGISSRQFDIVIPVGPHDLATVHKVVKYAQKNVIGHRNIYLLSCDRSIVVDGAITVDESKAPFNKASLAKYFKTEKCRGWPNWHLQQLLKFYAGFFIPDILEDYLVIDADVYFLKPTTFFDENGRCLLAFGAECHQPYFDHMARLHPSLVKKHQNLSGICHHMMFNREIIIEMIKFITKNNPENFVQVILRALDESVDSGMSEYEIYFNYMLEFHPAECAIRKLNWKNTYLIPNKFLELTIFYNQDFVSQFNRGGYLKNFLIAKLLRKLRVRTKSARHASKSFLKRICRI